MIGVNIIAVSLPVVQDKLDSDLTLLDMHPELEELFNLCLMDSLLDIDREFIGLCNALGTDDHMFDISFQCPF